VRGGSRENLSLTPAEAGCPQVTTLPQCLKMAALILDAIPGLVSLLVGTTIVIWTAWNVVSALLSRGWPHVTGTIVVSDLQRVKDTDGGYTYRPEVTYHYTVAGKEFVASRVAFGDRISLGWSAPAVKTVRRYRAGTSVVVRYNPNEPGEAVLQPGVHWLLPVAVLFGATFIAFGIFALRAAL
jgi:hypothetical protein